MTTLSLTDPLPQISQMLHGHLMMQHHKDKPTAWFREKLEAMHRPRLTVQRRWAIKSTLAYSERHQWYKAMIEQDETNFCNHFLGRMELETDAAHQQYLRHMAMSKLAWLMKEAQQLPLRLEELPANPETETHPLASKRQKLEEQDILAQLKACLAGLYLEVQATGTEDDAGFPALDEHTIYHYHYLEAPPVEPMLLPATPIVLPLPVKVEPEAFIPLRGDRLHQTGLKVSFADIADADKLFALEEKLFEHAVIDRQSRFIKNKANSHNKLMAVVYHVIAEAGIFRKTTVVSKILIQPNHIRAYLDKRYETNLQQEFRKTTAADREFACIKLPFLEHDPRFRKYRI